MQIIGIVLFLLSFGFSTGNNTICYECHARNVQYCKGEEIQCPEGSICMTVSERFGCNQTYYSIQKRCSMNLKCNEDLYAYVNNDIYFDLSRECCKGDLCNNGSIDLTNKTYQYDGPECPICASFDTLEFCEPVATTVCRQATDLCGGLAGWLIKPDNITTKFSVRGCMSQNACRYDHTEVIGYNMKNITNRNCYMPKSENDSSKETLEKY